MAWISRNLIIAFLLSAFVLFGFTTFLRETAATYDVEIPQEYNKIFDALGNATFENGTSASKVISGKIEQEKGLINPQNVFGISNVLFDAIKVPFQVGKDMPHIIFLIGQKIGFPAWGITIILSIVMLVIAYVVIELIFRRKA